MNSIAPLRGRIVSILIGAVLVCVAGYGLSQFQASDDLRKLQPRDADLSQQEEHIRRILGPGLAGQTLLVRGENLQQVLEREETIAMELDTLRNRQDFTGYRMVSHFQPSIKRQHQNLEALTKGGIVREQRVLLDRFALAAEPMEPCATGSAPQNDRKNLEDGVAWQILPNENVKDNHQAARPPQVHVIMLQGLHSSEGLKSLSAKYPWLYYLDPTDELIGALSSLRQTALLPLAAAWIVIAALLIFAEGIHRAARILAVPTLAALLTPFVAASMGEVFSAFSLMALVLVFAIGLDFCLFLSHARAQHRRVVLIANWLAALSSILAFGLLSFSSLYAVHSFGITLMIGISLAICGASLMRFTQKQEKNIPIEDDF